MIPTATQTSAPAVPARAMPAEEGKRSNALCFYQSQSVYVDVSQADTSARLDTMGLAELRWAASMGSGTRETGGSLVEATLYSPFTPRCCPLQTGPRTAGVGAGPSASSLAQSAA